MKNAILLFCFLYSILVFSHKNIQLEFKLDKVLLISSTVGYNEEINKSLILAKYTNILLDSLNYKKNIQILNFQSDDNVFSSHYNDRGIITFNFMQLKQIDIEEYLYFIYYVISNEYLLENEGIIIKEKIENINNSLIFNILKIKMERPNEVEEISKTFNFNYFYQNGLFNIYDKKSDSVILQIKELSQLEYLYRNELIVFLNNKDFYYLKNNKKHFFSFITPKDDYRNYKIIILSNDLFILSYSWGTGISLFNSKTLKFVENIKSLLEEASR